MDVKWFRPHWGVADRKQYSILQPRFCFGGLLTSFANLSPYKSNSTFSVGREMAFWGEFLRVLGKNDLKMLSSCM
jgi:hypothetical protein